jgi:hypothetical protein
VFAGANGIGLPDGSSNGSPTKGKSSGAVSKDQNPGDFSNFPEIQPKTVEGLVKSGIVSLFPV